MFNMSSWWVESTIASKLIRAPNPSDHWFHVPQHLNEWMTINFAINWKENLKLKSSFPSSQNKSKVPNKILVKQTRKNTRFKSAVPQSIPSSLLSFRVTSLCWVLILLLIICRLCHCTQHLCHYDAQVLALSCHSRMPTRHFAFSQTWTKWETWSCDTLCYCYPR